MQSEIFIFMYSLFLGLFLGFTYDIFRIVRMILNSKNMSIFLQDILYFVLSGVITFFFVLEVNSGNSRFYILAGEGIGWIVYHLTIGEFIYMSSGKIVKFIKCKMVSLWKKILKKKDDV